MTVLEHVTTQALDKAAAPRGLCKGACCSAQSRGTVSPFRLSPGAVPATACTAARPPPVLRDAISGTPTGHVPSAAYFPEHVRQGAPVGLNRPPRPTAARGPLTERAGAHLAQSAAPRSRRLLPATPPGSGTQRGKDTANGSPPDTWAPCTPPTPRPLPGRLSQGSCRGANGGWRAASLWGPGPLIRVSGPLSAPDL